MPTKHTLADFIESILQRVILAVFLFAAVHYWVSQQYLPFSFFAVGMIDMLVTYFIQRIRNGR